MVPWCAADFFSIWPQHRGDSFCVAREGCQGSLQFKGERTSDWILSTNLFFQQIKICVYSASDVSPEIFIQSLSTKRNYFVWPHFWNKMLDKPGAHLTLVSPNCSVFCFFRGLLAASSISSSSSVGTVTENSQTWSRSFWIVFPYKQLSKPPYLQYPTCLWCMSILTLHLWSYQYYLHVECKENEYKLSDVLQVMQF